MAKVNVKSGDVVEPPFGHVIETHDQGRFGIVRPLDAANRPPIRLRKRVAVHHRLFSYSEG